MTPVSQSFRAAALDTEGLQLSCTTASVLASLHAPVSTPRLDAILPLRHAEGIVLQVTERTVFFRAPPVGRKMESAFNAGLVDEDFSFDSSWHLRPLPASKCKTLLAGSLGLTAWLSNFFVCCGDSSSCL